MLSQLSEFLGSSFLARDKDGDTQTEALTITFGDVFDELSEENSVSGQNDVIDQLPETSEADAASGLTSKELLEADDEVLWTPFWRKYWLNDLDKTDEEKREDDNENVLKSRLDVYFDETKPLLDFYQKKNKLNKINGTQTINDVNDQINSHILNLKNA